MFMLEYLGYINEVADYLSVTINIISNNKNVKQTISGLRVDFHDFATALEVLATLPSFDNLQGKLLQHEMGMRQMYINIV